MKTNPFRTMSDDRIQSITYVQGALWHAFTYVRPTDALMQLVRKTMAYWESRAPK